MGGQLVHINISQTISYQGQVSNSIPHGRGYLRIKTTNKQNIKNKQKQKQNNKQPIWNIQAQLQMCIIKQCKAYHKNLMYAGEMKQNKFSGNGKVQTNNKLITYQGIFKNGILVNGEYCKKKQFYTKAIFCTADQSQKQNNNQLQTRQIMLHGGTCQFIWLQHNQKVVGTFKNNELQQKGKYIYQNGDTYEGNFKKGYFDGFGYYISINSSFKSIYGYFKYSIPNSITKNQITKVQFKNGDIYQGQFKDGNMHDTKCKYIYRNGITYIGQINNNQLKGYCQVTYNQKSIISKLIGQIYDGSFNGLTVIQYKNGVIMKGYMFNNKKNGPCVYIYGQRMWKCLYLMDQLVGKFKQIQVSNQ